MSERNGYLLLEEKIALLLDALRQMHFQCQKQKDLFEKASPEDIHNYTQVKNQRLQIFLKQLSEIHSLIQTLKPVDAEEKKKFDRIIQECERQATPLIDDIIAIESKDKIILSKLKDAVASEMEEVEKARAKLGDLKNSYSPNSKTPNLFDQRT